MRLIDADTCTELFDEEYRKTRQLIEQGEEYLDNLAEGFTEAYHVIQRMTTIDSAPVRHGRWDDSGKYRFPGGSIAVRCSECGCALTVSEYKLNNWNYCPVCGSKMDGERKDNV